VPNHPGQFSALGFLLTQARVDRQRTTHLTSRAFDKARAAAILESLVQEATDQLAEQGFAGEIKLLRTVEMRYLGQNYELALTINEADLAPDADIERLWQEFHNTHEARFGFATKGEIIEIVNFGVTAISDSAAPELPTLQPSDRPPAPIGRRRVGYVQGLFDSPVFDRATLRAGDVLDGPLLVEESASVTVVCPGQRVTVDGYGHLLIDTTQS